MKKSLSLLFSVILSVFALFLAAPSFSVKSEEKNLFPDGEFKDIRSEGNSIKIYRLNGWGSIGFSVKKSGENFYVKTSYNESDEHGLTPNDTITLNAGVYKFSFDASFSGAATVRLKEDSDVYVSGIISGQGEFTTCEFSFSLEESKNYGFTFYVADFTGDVSIDNLGLYYIGENAVEREPETFDGENITTEFGASIRASGTTSGLRFKGRVDKPFFDNLSAEYTDAEAGMIIAPTDFLSDCEFTVSALTARKAVQICTVSKWNNERTADTDGYYGFNCAIINVLPYNIDRRFSARCFVRFTENGKVKYIYGDYVEENNARSIKYVAEEALKDANSYSDYQINAINYFLDTIYYPDVTSVSTTDGGFVLRYSGLTGYFVLDYDRQEYTVSVVSFKVNGADADFSKGMVLLTESADVEISLSVLSGGDAGVCPVKGKIYRNR